MKLALIQVTIRRDQSTTTDVTVPPYEVTLLREIFGHENVHSEKHVSTIELDDETEFERLGAKYGEEIVVKTFGSRHLLDQHIQASKIKPGRPAGKDPDPADKEVK